MRTALFLLLLLAVGAIPGSTFPQRSIDAGPHDAVHRRQPHRGQGPRRPRVLRGLRLAVVRRDLPAPLRLAHRVRPAPQPDPLAPGALDPAEGAPAARPPCGTPQHGGRRRRPRRSASGCAGPCGAGATACTPTTTRRCRRRRATSARPATSSSTWRSSASSSGSRGVTCSAGSGDVIVPEGETLANTLSRYDTFSPGPWVDVNDLEPWTLEARPARRRVRDRDQGPRAVRRPARLRGDDDLHPAGQRAGAARRPGQRPARDRRRHRLPPRQRLRAADHGARRRRAPSCTPSRRSSSRRTTTTPRSAR